MARAPAAGATQRTAVGSAAARDGGIVTGTALGAVVERLTGLEWGEALDRARGLGGLVGAYPAEASG